MGKKSKLKAQGRGEQQRESEIEQLQSQRGEHRRLYDVAIRNGVNHIRGSVVFVIDEVNELARKEVFQPAQLVNIRPPFPSVFLECNHIGAKGMWGVHILSIDDTHLEATLVELSHQSGKCVVIAGWMVEIAPDGSFAGDVMLHQARYVLSLRVPPEEMQRHIVARLMVALQAINAMNTTTVEISEHEPAMTPRLAKLGGTKPVKFKVLHIKPLTHTKESDATTKSKQDIMPQHLRRAHEATYTEDAPLFGKYVGTFPRRASVVGNKKNGVVVKDYKVDTG